MLGETESLVKWKPVAAIVPRLSAMSTEMLAGWPVWATRNYLDDFRERAARFC